MDNKRTMDLRAAREERDRLERERDRVAAHLSQVEAELREAELRVFEKLNEELREAGHRVGFIEMVLPDYAEITGRKP